MSLPEASAADRSHLADISITRLGKRPAPGNSEVTGVSIVGNYGLSVYSVGAGTGEALFLKEGSTWRVLGSNAYDASGRGLLHFGVSPDLARNLIAGLQAPPSQ
jgi:hypothetical protein